MAILDERNEFCDATALSTAGTADYILGDVIDTGGDGREGAGEDLYLVIEVTTAVTSAGAATVDFQLLSDSTADLATSPTTHFTTGAIGKATLVAGYQVCAVQLPKGTYERYLGLWQDIGTAALTAGAVNAYLTKCPPDWAAVADGVPSEA